MPTREKIREGIEFSNEFRLTRLGAKIIRENLDKSPTEISNMIVRAFSLEGVVIAVEGELPAFGCCPEFAKCSEFCHTLEQLNMLKAGYKKTIPLVEG